MKTQKPVENIIELAIKALSNLNHLKTPLKHAKTYHFTPLKLIETSFHPIKHLSRPPVLPQTLHLYNRQASWLTISAEEEHRHLRSLPRAERSIARGIVGHHHGEVRPENHNRRPPKSGDLIWRTTNGWTFLSKQIELWAARVVRLPPKASDFASKHDEFSLVAIPTTHCVCTNKKHSLPPHFGSLSLWFYPWYRGLDIENQQQAGKT